MSYTRRRTLYQLLGCMAALWNRTDESHVQGAPCGYDVANPPKEISGNIHGREIRLKYNALKSHQQAALYCHLWFLHLTYGLVIDQPFLADESGIELTFGKGAELSRTYKIKPMTTGHEITEDAQAYLVLLSSAILAAVTQGDGFTQPAKNGNGENAARNWFTPVTGTSLFDGNVIPICKSVLQSWAGQESRELPTQMDKLKDRQWMAATSRYDRMKTIIDWLLLQRPSAQELRSSLVVKSMIQTLVDFGRYQYCWMEHFARVRSQKVARKIVGDFPTRARCRLLTTAFAFKSLFPGRKLPAIQFAMNPSPSDPLDIVLESVGSTYISFNGAVFSDRKLTTTELGKQGKSDLSLSECFSVGDDVWDYPLYALVASLGLGATGGRRKKFVELTKCKEGDAVEQVVPFGAVLITGDDPETRASLQQINISVTDWDGFKDWTEFKP